MGPISTPGVFRILILLAVAVALLLIAIPRHVSSNRTEQIAQVKDLMKTVWNSISLYAEQENGAIVPRFDSKEPPDWWADYSKWRQRSNVTVQVANEVVGLKLNSIPRDSAVLEAQGKMVDDAFAGIDMTLILKRDDSVVVKDRNHGGSK